MKRAQPLRKRVVEPVTHDELALYQDSELEARNDFLHDEMQRRGIMPYSYGAIPYEVELAYVYREQLIRMKRRQAHKAYLSSLDEGYVDESSLPEFKATPPPWYWN